MLPLTFNLRPVTGNSPLFLLPQSPSDTSPLVYPKTLSLFLYYSEERKRVLYVV